MRDRRGRTYTPAIGPRLRPLLWVILISFAILGANGFYLASVTALTWYLGTTQQTFFYMLMVVLHLLLGFLLIVPFVVFGFVHLATSWKRPNRGAVRYGLALLATALVLLVSGIVLVRIGGFEVRDPWVREVGYWLHVLAPLAAIALYVKHRLAGPMIRWHWARRFGVAVAGFVVLMGLLHREDPRSFGVKGPKEGKQYFYPSEAITANGKFIPAKTLMMDDYCLKCHKDAYDGWFHSAHHFSSFNNKPYLSSVRETRKVSLKRDGEHAGRALVRRVPRPGAVLLGRVRRPELRRRQRPDQPGRHHLHRRATRSPTSTARAATPSTRSRSRSTIPFASSDNPVLQWINQTLVKAKPEMHKKTFLKPVIKDVEFCSTCHKVGHPVRPEPLQGLRPRPEPLRHVPALGRLRARGPELLLSRRGEDDLHRVPHGAEALDRLRRQGLRRQGRPRDPRPLLHRGQHGPGGHPGRSRGRRAARQVPGRQEGPRRHLRPPRRRRHRRQARRRRCDPRPRRSGRAGSISSRSSSGRSASATPSARARSTPTRSGSSWRRGRTARSSAIRGGSGPTARSIPSAHFINVYMLDRDGNRIDRRNPQDIFVPLYNKQIPPGAGQVVHFGLEVPEGATGPIKLEAKVNYRKFDRTYMDYIFGKGKGPELPIVVMAQRRGPARRRRAVQPAKNEPSPIQPAWQRWNDYGIGLLARGPGEGRPEGRAAAGRGGLPQGRRAGPRRRLGQPRARLPEGRPHPRGAWPPWRRPPRTRSRRPPGSSTG